MVAKSLCRGTATSPGRSMSQLLWTRSRNSWSVPQQPRPQHAGHFFADRGDMRNSLNRPLVCTASKRWSIVPFSGWWQNQQGSDNVIHSQALNTTVSWGLAVVFVQCHNNITVPKGENALAGIPVTTVSWTAADVADASNTETTATSIPWEDI